MNLNQTHREVSFYLLKLFLLLFARAASLCHRHILLAQRTFIWLVRLDIEMQERMIRHIAKADFAAAAVHEHANSHWNTARLAHDVYDFFDRAARRHDVLDDEHALALVELEAATERHLAIDALREYRACA